MTTSQVEDGAPGCDPVTWGSLGPRHSALQLATPPSHVPAAQGMGLKDKSGGGAGGVVLPGVTDALEIPPARSSKRLASCHILELLTPV